MTKRQLEIALKEAEKLRDQWCAEYVKLRDRKKKRPHSLSS